MINGAVHVYRRSAEPPGLLGHGAAIGAATCPMGGDYSRFDVVIANPPFSLKHWGADTWATDPRGICAVPPASNGDLGSVQHMASSMTPDAGRVGVVMPHGVLFRGGLPPNLFYSTSIPACLLILRGQKEEAPMDRQYVGIDFHCRRSVIVRKNTAVRS